MINSQKRKYEKPRLESHDIDRDISLVMMTWVDENNPPDPGGPGGLPGVAEQQPWGPPAAQQSNPFDQNPFGEQ
ncbi:hypothetical protein DMA11_19730 [Marinilabiliaceae bacterium JC017]|nr:hypothetical protein DMA11_19730 [Marinilabiliaceae bacterium JC017]